MTQAHARYRRRTILSRMATAAGCILVAACDRPAATRRAVMLVEHTATPRPTPTSPPTQTLSPTLTTIATRLPSTPMPRPTAMVMITPAEASPGTGFAVEATNLAPVTAYVIQILGASGRRYRDDYPVTSDAAGTWSGFFNSASHDPPGVYTIRFVAKQGGVIIAVGMFTMTR